MEIRKSLHLHLIGEFKASPSKLGLAKAMFLRNLLILATFFSVILLLDRTKQAIEAVKQSIAKPRFPSFPLIECEFPVLQSQNKLGDGSLRSKLEAERVS